MCTSMAFKTDDFYFGRNMDIDCSFKEQVVLTPRNYRFSFRKEGVINSHFAIMGMASVENNYPLYAEAFNEKGLCMAGLNFPGNAYYGKKSCDGKYNISPFEIIAWVLSQCENANEACELLKKTSLVSIPFSDNLPLAELHWHIADSSGSFILESTRDGMHIYENPVHILTNNPPFDFHLTNLAQYLNLDTGDVKNCFWEKIGTRAFGKGMGSVGLPGDFSPASRFVKIAYLRLNSVCKNGENESISQFFHLLDSVAVVNGSIRLSNGKAYMTTYSCCINTDKGIYYYKTYFNNRITAVNMFNEKLDSKELLTFPLVSEQQIFKVN